MHETPLEQAASLLLELAIILLAAKLVGEIFERFLKLPSVLGELTAGIIISPFALGGLEIFGLGPLFPIIGETAAAVGETVSGAAESSASFLPVDEAIFFVSQIGAVVLLFHAGLETNRPLFIRYAKQGVIVALGGVIVPFFFGFFTTILFGFASFGSISELLPALFIGSAFTATSVGITARVLSDLKHLDSPESVTILAAAVVDDVLGLIILAIISAVGLEGEVTASSIGIIFAKAVGFWLGLTIIGSLLAPFISKFILGFKSGGAWTVIALGFAFTAAAVAEKYFGLAMIIGSYSLGLALSATRLKERIEPAVSSVTFLLAPVFFAVIGMQVDFTAIFNGSIGLTTVISFAVVLSLAGVVSKMLGTGLPALAIGFNRRGAFRIASGMLPRGEVALIVAGIGLGNGIISRSDFGFVIVMTVVTTVLAPVLLKVAFKGGPGLRKKAEVEPV